MLNVFEPLRLNHVFNADDQRWLTHNSKAITFHHRKFLHRLNGIATHHLGHHFVGLGHVCLWCRELDLRQEILHISKRVPDVECVHARKLKHRGAIPRCRGAHCGPALLAFVAAITSGDFDARTEALDVPLDRPGQSLVEVVDVEDETTLR
ncbi:unannotated protein [freshwater metagenome]|uniref:Unannotated protein n=1 Tax=freshwater metagenome TaxID=449393 RepID=A0A6J7GTU3_9ZZZZ